MKCRFVGGTDRELIDRTELLAVALSGTGYLSVEELIDAIEAAPVVDAVEVVRCKDCVFYRETQDWSGDAYKACHLRADVIIPKRNQDAFCSYGERKTNNE